MTEPRHRLFFALWPEAGMLEPLVERVREFAPAGLGRVQRPDQLHVTLQFLGEVPASRLADVLAAGAAAAVDARPFHVVFDALSHWRGPQVLCLTARETPAALVALVDALRRQLEARGFTTERREFQAHLTLARKVQRRPRIDEFELVRWPAREFTLVESVTGPAGTSYERRAAWPLGR